MTRHYVSPSSISLIASILLVAVLSARMAIQLGALS